MKATKLLLVLSLFLCVGCKQLQQYHGHSEHDSTVQVKVMHDSIYFGERDSVYLFRSPDSVYKEVWRIRYRDRERLKVDTLIIERIKADTIIQKEVVGNHKATRGGKPTVLLVALILVAVLLLSAFLFYKGKIRRF